jgi:hypothetical protein
MADIAAKQFRAEELRQRLAVLRVQHTADVQEADTVSLDAKLDEEIAQLEKQVAIEEQRKASGGSVTEAMDVMAAAARLEEEQAASLEQAAGSAIASGSASDGVDTTSSPTTSLVVTDNSEAETPVAPVAGMGLMTPTVASGGNQ